jgi:hypothetical protein
MKQRREQLERLFAEQHGRCHWCNAVMVLLPKGYNQKENPRNRATVDHLDDRWSPRRGTFNERRHVAACWQCNNKRGAESLRQQMIADPQSVWKKSRARPLLFIDIWEGYYRGWTPRMLRRK